MAESCDVYFYTLGQKLGSRSIAEAGRAFGLGQAVQSILPGEQKGNIPDPIWKKKVGLGGWSTGDTYNMSIGQGFVTTTPLQIVVMMAALASHGEIRRPYVVDRLVDAEGNTTVVGKPEVRQTMTLQDSTWAALGQSLKDVVSEGTGMATQIAHLDVQGKTGTAQNPHGDDHAWFSAYAGYKGERPSVAICVLVENGGHGGSVAAPIAKAILETALPKREGPEGRN